MKNTGMSRLLLALAAAAEAGPPKLLWRFPRQNTPKPVRKMLMFSRFGLWNMLKPGRVVTFCHICHVLSRLFWDSVNYPAAMISEYSFWHGLGKCFVCFVFVAHADLWSEKRSWEISLYRCPKKRRIRDKRDSWVFYYKSTKIFESVNAVEIPKIPWPDPNCPQKC